MKAFLIAHQLTFPKIHDLLDLIDNLIMPLNASFIEIREHAIILNDYGVNPRYPDFVYEFTSEDASQAYEAANTVKKFVWNLLSYKAKE